MSSDQDTRHRTDAPHPPHDPVPLHPVATEIIAEWPAGTFIENLAHAFNGSAWLVTIPSHHRVDWVHANGRHEVLADLPHSPTGIVTHQTGALVISGPLGHEGWQLLRIRDHGYEVVCDVPGLLSGNGMAWVDQRLLLADSLLGLVLSMDPARGTSSVWLAHELLTKTDPASPLPGVNGIAAGHGWVYLTNTERGLLLRCPTDSTDPAKDLQVVAERLAGDDLDVGSDGRIYLATHTWGNSILRLDPDGHREDIAGHDQGITGSTAVAFDPGDTSKLYVTTTGGILSPYGGQIEPARLVRLNP